MQQPFDRAAEDLGNSIHFEHVNVTIPDQRLATLFYVAGLGLTRDPYLMVSDTNMWVNVGRSQFHLPSGAPQVLRGHTGIVIAGREALLERLASVAKKLEGTAFAFSEHNDYVEAICPWGNRVRCYEPDAARFGRITLGIPYVEFDVPVGHRESASARSILQIMGMPAELHERRRRRGARQGRQGSVSAIPRDRPARSRNSTAITCRSTSRIFRSLPPAAGARPDLAGRQPVSIPLSRHHRPRRTAGTCSRSSTRCAAPRTRCIMRPLVNRNPAETNRTYAPGHEQWLRRWDRMSTTEGRGVFDSRATSFETHSAAPQDEV